MCKWYETLSGVCCNSECEYVGDIPPAEYCKKCEFNEKNEKEIIKEINNKLDEILEIIKKEY